MCSAALPLWGQLQRDGDLSIACSTPVLAGATTTCAISLSTSAQVNALTFGVSVSPGSGAPALSSGTLTFSDLVSGGFSSPAGANAIAVVWASMNPAISGQRTLGNISFTIPATATAGQTYSAGFTGVSGAYNSTSLLIMPGSASTVSVQARPAVSVTDPSSLSNGAVGSVYPSVWFSASGGNGGYTWSASGLPPGLAFSAGGQLSGTPTQSGSFSPTFTVTDSSSATASVTLDLLIGADSSSCTYTLSSASAGLTASGGSGSVTVTTGSSCLWTASVTGGPAWLWVIGSASGMGSGAVQYQAAVNSGAGRSGSLNIGNAAFAVYQTGSASASSGTLPHFAAGNGWTTTITIVNLWPATEHIRLSFLNNDGASVALPVNYPLSPASGHETVSAIDKSLTAGSELIIKTTNPSDPVAIEGSMRLSTDGKADVSCIYTWSGEGGQEAVVRNEDRDAPAFLLPFDNVANVKTGVALTNVSGQAVTVPVILRDSSGAQLGTGAINLSAYGHTSFMLPDKFPVTSGQFGTAEFDRPGSAPISVMGIRVSPTGAITSIPVLAR
jgi:hypothetical protein